MSLELARQESRAYADWLSAHGYWTSEVYRFTVALNDYGPCNRRTEYATGYAVRYEGQLIRDDGSMAEYATAGVTVFCEDSQLPLAKLVKSGRALLTFGDVGPYAPYYVAAYNPRETDVQRDQSVNMGTMQTVILHKLSPMWGGDGPKRFYDIRLTAE